MISAIHICVILTLIIFSFVTALNQLYTGDKDIILDLPENFDIYSIDYISLFNFQFAKDFGHVKVSNVGDKIPPYVPVQSKV